MAAQVYIDGVEITNTVIEGSATRRLNRPAQATIKIPIDLAVGDVGSRLKVVFDGGLFFHGMILLIEDEADEDFGYTTYNATDPMELWQWRPCRDYFGDTPGNMINPSFMKRMKSGPQIIAEILIASQNSLLIPEAAEGPLFVFLNGFETGGPNLSGAPTNWPMTIMEMVNLLTSTGAVDVILTPIDSGGNMAELNVYNGDYGTDRRGSVFFDYAMGNNNVRAVRRSIDLSNACNKLLYHIGPKKTIERFQANIQGFDPCLNDPSLYNQSLIQARRIASQASYGVRMEIQQFDVDLLYNEKDRTQPKSGSPLSYPNFCSAGDYTKQDPSRFLYRKLWQIESWVRAVPRDLVHVTPVRVSDADLLPAVVNPVSVGDFDIGDMVTVRAGATFRGGFSGAQRVYGYTVAWDTEGTIELSEIQVSSDQEGLS